MERKKEKVDSTSVAFSPLETNSSTQTAYHQAAYPDQAVTKRCPAPASNQSRTRSRWDRPTQLGQLLDDTEGKNKNTMATEAEPVRATFRHLPSAPEQGPRAFKKVEVSMSTYSTNE